MLEFIQAHYELNFLPDSNNLWKIQDFITVPDDILPVETNVEITLRARAYADPGC